MQLVTQIGNSETALTEDPSDEKTVMQDRSQRERHPSVPFRRVIITADRTRIHPVYSGKAIITSLPHQSPRPFLQYPLMLILSLQNTFQPEAA